jgi:hypothetical protein
MGQYRDNNIRNIWYRDFKMEAIISGQVVPDIPDIIFDVLERKSPRYKGQRGHEEMTEQRSKIISGQSRT